MQPAYQVPLRDEALDNTNWTSDWIRVLPGSTIRSIFAITAVAGAPNGSLYTEFQTAPGDPVIIRTVAFNVVNTWANVDTVSAEYVRMRLTQAGGVNTITYSLDLIIQPPDSTPA